MQVRIFSRIVVIARALSTRTPALVAASALAGAVAFSPLPASPDARHAARVAVSTAGFTGPAREEYSLWPVPSRVQQVRAAAPIATPRVSGPPREEYSLWPVPRASSERAPVAVRAEAEAPQSGPRREEFSLWPVPAKPGAETAQQIVVIVPEGGVNIALRTGGM